ncbi:hypothetical protein DBK40_24095 [Salmonella enterica subsp. enterica serovar Typhi]|nr:hypothetical protein DBK40_24095 [Salmonella enterica subsp. enterica serovar Typhi]
MILLINPCLFDAIAEGVKKRRYHYFAKKYKNKRTIKNSLDIYILAPKTNYTLKLSTNGHLVEIFEKNGSDGVIIRPLTMKI